MPGTSMRSIIIQGKQINVPPTTSADTIAILRAATPFYSSKFVYTGNHAHGTDSDNGGAEEFLRHCGVWDTNDTDTRDEYDTVCERNQTVFTDRALDARDYNSSLLYGLERLTGIHTLQTKNGILTYHVQKHMSPFNPFGYDINGTYRMISLEKTT